MLSEEFVAGIREFGEYDWIQFIDIGHVLIEETGTNEDLIPRGVRAAVELVRRGVLTPGEITDQGFVAWNISQYEFEKYVHLKAEELVRLRRIFWPGDICWFRTSDDDDR